MQYQILGPFDIACIHCRALHFPKERVTNCMDRNSFGDCCLHLNETITAKIIKWISETLFRVLFAAKKLHKRIRNLNVLFVLTPFNMNDERTTNTHGFYSFIDCSKDIIKWIWLLIDTKSWRGYWMITIRQLYFLDSDDAIN